MGARRSARCLQKLGLSVRFRDFQITNVFGSCSLPVAINLVGLTERYNLIARYEPDLCPGVIFTLESPKATFRIFTTGKITVIGWFSIIIYIFLLISHLYITKRYQHNYNFTRF